MSRILLVYEDFQQMTQTQAILKRIGMDVVGVSSEIGLSEQIVSFNPDLVIASGAGTRVSAANVGSRLKEMLRWQGKVILIFPQNAKPQPQDLIRIRMDLMLESPVPPNRLIGVLSRLLGLDELAMLERHQKAEAAVAENIQIQQQAAAMNDIFVRSKENAKKDDPLSAFDKALDQWVKKAPAVGGEDSPKEKIEEKSDSRSQDLVARDKDQFSNDKNGASSVDIDAETLAQLRAELESGGAEYVQGGGSGQKEMKDSGSKQGASVGGAKPYQPPSVVDPKEDLSESVKSVAADLEEAKKRSRERVLRYSDKMQPGVSLSKESTVTRKKAKAALRSMSKDWKKEELDHLDKLRREFTAAMFKKK